MGVDLAHEILDLDRLRDVGVNQHRVSAAFHKSVHHVLSLDLVAIRVDDHGGALASKRERDCPSDAPRRSGDERHSTVQAAHDRHRLQKSELVLDSRGASIDLVLSHANRACRVGDYCVDFLALGGA